MPVARGLGDRPGAEDAVGAAAAMRKLIALHAFS